MSLFPKEQTPEGKAKFEENYQKVLKTVAAKQEIRDRELWDADVKISDEKVVQVTRIDNDAFFASASDESDVESVEKRPVMKDGRVPKLQKNF